MPERSGGRAQPRADTALGGGAGATGRQTEACRASRDLWERVARHAGGESPKPRPRRPLPLDKLDATGRTHHSADGNGEDVSAPEAEHTKRSPERSEARGFGGGGAPVNGAGRASDDRSDQPSLRAAGALSRFISDQREPTKRESAREPQRVFGRGRRRNPRPKTRRIRATDLRNISGLMERREFSGEGATGVAGGFPLRRRARMRPTDVSLVGASHKALADKKARWGQSPERTPLYNEGAGDSRRPSSAAVRIFCVASSSSGRHR